MTASPKIDITTMAEMIEGMLPALHAAPSEGYDRRVMRLVVEDDADGGSLIVDEIEFDPGEPEVLVAALRAYRGGEA